MPKVDLSTIQERSGSIYPAPHDAEMAGRSSLRFSDACGLSQFGANITILKPGAKSSLRHWHENQDEMVMIIEGQATLEDDNGETALAPGDIATFPAGDENGHRIVNNSNADVRFLVIGARTPTETAWYSDLDMKIELHPDGYAFTHKDGTPYKGDDK